MNAACLAQRPRRPQLSDAIDKLDQMIDTLATAIPGAVADSVREVLGDSLTTAIREAVRDATAEALKATTAETLAAAIAAPEVPAAAPVSAAPADHRPGIWDHVKSVTGQLRRWAARRAAPSVTRLALGWAIVKVIGSATIRSRSATLATLLTGALAGMAGVAAGPVASAILLGLAGGAMTATVNWAAPAVRLLVAFRDE